ncbi:hypothetical protein TPAR_03948, partial [Tolypocladium paradoxum]
MSPRKRQSVLFWWELVLRTLSIASLVIALGLMGYGSSRFDVHSIAGYVMACVLILYNIAFLLCLWGSLSPTSTGSPSRSAIASLGVGEIIATGLAILACMFTALFSVRPKKCGYYSCEDGAKD